jgi:hypothetical protein
MGVFLIFLLKSTFKNLSSHNESYILSNMVCTYISAGVGFITAITQIRVAIAASSRRLTCCMNIADHEIMESSVSIYRVHSVSTDNILMCMCEV